MRAAIICTIGLIGPWGHAGAEPLIEGRVRLPSGAPAAGAQVRLFDLADLRAAPIGATTDQSGHFTLPLGALPGTALPERFELGSNYPNPFNPSTLIPYQLPSSMHVRLEVFNLLGQRIATLVDGEQPAGFNTAEWDATDAAGQAVGAGVYLYRLSGDAGKITRRMLLVDGQAGSVWAGSAAAARDEAGPAWETALAYGLTVSGPGLVPYVDPAFRVTAGMSPLDVVVETPSSAPRAKVASGGILGDVDNTGRVDFLDALLVALYSRDSSIVMPNSGDISLGDVDADGRVDLSDVWAIAAYLNDPTDPTLPAGIGESVGPAASLSPDPATVTWADDGAWHPFSVEAGEPVSVVVNPAGTTPRLEITTRGGQGNHCPAEADDDASREAGQTIYLSGCAAGKATVELRREADGTVLRSYTFEVTGTAPDLVVRQPSFGGSVPRAESFLSATVHNQGTAPSPSTTLRFYQSTDTTFTTADTEVGTAPVVPLGAPGGTVANIRPTAPSAAGTYYYGACVDAVSGESDTTNNCSTALTVIIGPDLVVDTPTVSNSSPTAGASFTLSTAVRNRGNMSSVSTTLRYIRSADSTITTSDTEVGTDQVSNLGVTGGVPVQSVVLTAPSDPGTYYYGACVDSVTGEFDTPNNCSGAVTVTVGEAPDLVVDTPTVSESAPVARTSFTISVTVRNEGSSPAGSTTLRYYGSIDTDLYPEFPATTFNELPFHTDSVSGLAPSGSSTHSTSRRAWDRKTTRYYKACVDAVPGENDVANNCSAAVTVAVAGTHDLVVDTPTVDTSALAAGAQFTLSATVRNQGRGRSSYFTTLRYYRSTDSTITTGDTELDTRVVNRLDPSESEEESISLTAPSSSGTYYYGACVDPLGDEDDMSNNCSAALKITLVPADLVVEALTTTYSNSNVYSSFPVDVSVRNLGNLASGPTTLNYYRSTDSTITTSDEQIRSDSIGGLSPDETVSLHSSLRAPSEPGTYYYGACVVSVPDESDTANNCSPALKVVGGQLDLVVETPWISHRNATGGSYIDIHAVVRNEGTGHLPDFTDFKVYSSTDSTTTTVGDDSYEAGYIWRPMDMFASSEGLTASLWAPDTAGEYYYYACVGSTRGELSEANNCSATVKLTVRPSDLTFLLPTASPNILTAGASFTLRATVLNGGDVRSADSATTIRYYRSTDATITSTDRSVGTDWLIVPSAHATEEKLISLTAPRPGTYYYGACVDPVSDESDRTNNCSEAVEVTVGERPLTLRLTSCFVLENQHFVMFEVRANVPVSDVVVHTYQIEGRNNKLHLMETTNVGNLSAGDSYEKLTSRYFPAHLRPYLTTCTATVEWANGTDTPGFDPTTIIVPDLPRPPPTYRPPAYDPSEFRTPTEHQVWQLLVDMQGTVYGHHISCGYSGRPPCPSHDHIAWWSALPSSLQGCAFHGGCHFPQDSK